MITSLTSTDKSITTVVEMNIKVSGLPVTHIGFTSHFLDAEYPLSCLIVGEGNNHYNRHHHSSSLLTRKSRLNNLWTLRVQDDLKENLWWIGTESKVMVWFFTAVTPTWQQLNKNSLERECTMEPMGTAQWVKCLPCTCEDQSLDPKHSGKCQVGTPACL
jgi:hypothetical protein